MYNYVYTFYVTYKVLMVFYLWGENYKKCSILDFHGGIVDGNPPATAGDTGSIPDPGRLHMLQSNSARGPQRLKAEHPEPVLHDRRGHRNEKQPPLTTTQRKPMHSYQDPVQSKK